MSREAWRGRPVGRGCRQKIWLSGKNLQFGIGRYNNYSQRAWIGIKELVVWPGMDQLPAFADSCVPLADCSRLSRDLFFHAGRFFQKSPAFKLPNYQLFTYLCSRN